MSLLEGIVYDENNPSNNNPPTRGVSLDPTGAVRLSSASFTISGLATEVTLLAVKTAAQAIQARLPASLGGAGGLVTELAGAALTHLANLDTDGLALVTSAASLDTKMPSSITQGDSGTNGSALPAAARLEAFDGSNWLRLRVGRLGALSAATLGQILNVLSSGQYNASGVTLTDGQGATLQLSRRGLIRMVAGVSGAAVDGYDKTSITGASLAADNAIFSGAGRADLIHFTNKTGGQVFVGVYDTNAALVASTSVPEIEQSVANNATVRMTINNYPFTSGYRIGISTGLGLYQAASSLTTSVLSVTHKVA